MWSLRLQQQHTNSNSLAAVHKQQYVMLLTVTRSLIEFLQDDLLVLLVPSVFVAGLGFCSWLLLGFAIHLQQRHVCYWSCSSGEGCMCGPLFALWLHLCHSALGNAGFCLFERSVYLCLVLCCTVLGHCYCYS